MAKKRHHTVSEFLLGRFAHDDGKVCQLDVCTGANKKISPNDATVVKHFYSIDIDDGKRSPEVEDALGKIESAAAPRIEALVNGDLRPEGQERLELAYFLAMTWLRTPRWRDQTRSVLEQGLEYWFSERASGSTVDELRIAMGEMAEAISDAEVIGLRDEFLADMEAGRAGIEMPTNGMIGMFLQSMTSMGLILFCLDWGVVRTEARLILADTPASLYDPTPMYPGSAAGLLGSPNSEFFMPLDPHCGLVLFPNPKRLDQLRAFANEVRELDDDAVLDTVAPLEGRWAQRQVDAAMVADMNLRGYCHAQRFVFGHQKAVSDTHSTAKAAPMKRRAMMPPPARLHILEDDPTRRGLMRAARIIEPQPSGRGRSRR